VAPDAAGTNAPEPRTMQAVAVPSFAMTRMT
jgi:hypothetical protein